MTTSVPPPAPADMPATGETWLQPKTGDPYTIGLVSLPFQSVEIVRAGERRRWVTFKIFLTQWHRPGQTPPQALPAKVRAKSGPKPKVRPPAPPPPAVPGRRPSPPKLRTPPAAPADARPTPPPLRPPVPPPPRVRAPAPEPAPPAEFVDFSDMVAPEVLAAVDAPSPEGVPQVGEQWRKIGGTDLLTVIEVSLALGWVNAKRDGGKRTHPHRLADFSRRWERVSDASGRPVVPRSEESPGPETPAAEDDDPSLEPRGVDDDPIPFIEHARAAANGDRGKHVHARHFMREEKRSTKLSVYPEDVERPRTRGDCKDGPRPCPFASCRYHLYLEADPATGSIRLNQPHKEPWELKESCALDVADRGESTLQAVADLAGCTRERIRQLEYRALKRLSHRALIKAVKKAAA